MWRNDEQMDYGMCLGAGTCSRAYTESQGQMCRSEPEPWHVIHTFNTIRLRSRAISAWVPCWTGQMSRPCFSWTLMSRTIGLPFGAKWMPIHCPCGFSFKDREPSSTGLTLPCAVVMLVNVQFYVRRAE